MTSEQRDLARRAVACKGWQWMPGMAYLRRGRSHRVDPEVLVSGGSYDDTCLPDLTDPATLGCLLALVREAHKCPQAHIYWATVTRLWVVRWGGEGLGERTVDANTEAEALIRALEAAP